MMTVKEKIQKVIRNSLDNIFKSDLDFNKIEIEIDTPPEPKFGDYSTPLALKLAKTYKDNPSLVAKKIADYILLNYNNLFDKVEIAPPGFINFFLNKKFLISELLNIYRTSEKYGADEEDFSEKYIIEFVSANPTGPLNVVNARAASVGDTLSKILKFLGKSVYKEYYINDAGNQVLLLGKSLLYRIKQLNGENIQLPDDCYQGEYLIDIAKEFINSDEYNNITSKPENEQIEILANYAVKKIVENQKISLKDFGVEFDNWFSENELRKSKLLNEVYKILNEKNLLYENENKIYFKSSLFGDEKDRVIIREDKTPTYFFVDIAYHLSKYKRGFTKIIDFWGPDHYGYIPRLQGALKALGFNENSFIIKIVQQVNLIEDNEKIRMSKRAGKFITMNELIKKVGKDAARFFFLHRTLESHLDFDVNLALKQCEENPVYYIQYAHARIASIFNEIKKRNINLPSNIDEYNLNLLLQNKEEIELVKHLINFPDVIRATAEKFQPVILTNYLLILATKFHKFYTEHRVISENIELTKSRVFLIKCTQIVLKIGLNLAGISAPDKM